jgi:predicted AlkP superfamily pyrophosphatase or phosphodiesterase
VPAEREPLLVVQCAALGHEFLARANGGTKLAGLEFHAAEAVFPAVTCTAQASFRTATAPAEHGVVANGFFRRELKKAFFWEQSSALVRGRRIWERRRSKGARVGVLFWQQSLGGNADVIVSPAPIHKHHGGMILDCFSKPAGLYRELTAKFGEFPLSRYWGPRAGAKSTRWIARATAELIRQGAADVLFTYLPHLDYELQRTGPESKGALRAFGALSRFLEELLDAAREAGWRVVVWGDYAIRPVSRAVFPNKLLREAGLLRTRSVRRMLYPDIPSSRAFAMVDHQVAHVYVPDAADVRPAKELLAAAPGVARALDADGKREAGVDSANAGELVLVAEPDAWFAYPWWDAPREAPEYATHIDIHNKPGYDPCELFWGTWPVSVSTDATRVRGSHGLVGKGAEVAWATDLDLEGEPGSVLDLARAVGRHLDGGAA